MIGFGCDGASGCLGHRLELSVKDALKSTFFSTLKDLPYDCILYMRNLPRNVAH